MHRRTFHLLIALLIVAGLLRLLIPPPALAAGEEVRSDLNGWGTTSWSMSASLGGTFIYVSGQITNSDNPNTQFKFYKNSNLWYGKFDTTPISFGSIFTGLSSSGSAPNIIFNHISGRYYVFKWDGGGVG